VENGVQIFNVLNDANSRSENMSNDYIRLNDKLAA